MVMVFSPQSSVVAYVPFKWVELLDNWGVRLGSLGWRLGLGRWLRLLGAGPEQAACYCAATHHTPTQGPGPWSREINISINPHKWLSSSSSLFSVAVAVALLHALQITAQTHRYIKSTNLIEISLWCPNIELKIE